MVINMAFQLLLVGSLAASFYIFMKGVVEIGDDSNSKCSTYTVTYGSTIESKLSETSQVLCNFPTGAIGFYVLLLITFAIITILKPNDKSKRWFLTISILFGILYYIMLLTGVAYFISTLV